MESPAGAGDGGSVTAPTPPDDALLRGAAGGDDDDDVGAADSASAAAEEEVATRIAAETGEAEPPHTPAAGGQKGLSTAARAGGRQREACRPGPLDAHSPAVWADQFRAPFSEPLPGSPPAAHSPRQPSRSPAPSFPPGVQIWSRRQSPATCPPSARPLRARTGSILTRSTRTGRRRSSPPRTGRRKTARRSQSTSSSTAQTSTRSRTR
jgi:hypothetical protein